MNDKLGHLAERLQSGIPLLERPYASLASELDCDEATVLALTNELIRDGYVRSFGAFIDFERLGYEGLLCGLIAPEAQLPHILSRLGGHEVTHSYLRLHRVNLWLTAVIGQTEKPRFMERLRSCEAPFVALATEARLKLSPVFSFMETYGAASHTPLFNQGTRNKEDQAVLSEIDVAALSALQSDFPVAPQPFEPTALALGLTTPQLLSLLERLKDARVLRRIGASLHHLRIGYAANALVAWNVGTSSADSAGRLASSFPWVSHCYMRHILENALPFAWPYRLYTMLHATDDASLDIRLKAMKDALSIDDSVVLPTVKELKKTRPFITGEQLPRARLYNTKLS